MNSPEGFSYLRVRRFAASAIFLRVCGARLRVENP